MERLCSYCVQPQKLNHKCRNPMMEAYLEATKISAEAKEESGEEHPPTFAALDEARSYIQREVPSMVSRHGKYDRVISNCRDTNCKAQLEYKALEAQHFCNGMRHTHQHKGPRRIAATAPHHPQGSFYSWKNRANGVQLPDSISRHASKRPHWLQGRARMAEEEQSAA